MADREQCCDAFSLVNDGMVSLGACQGAYKIGMRIAIGIKARKRVTTETP